MQVCAPKNTTFLAGIFSPFNLVQVLLGLMYTGFTKKNVIALSESKWKIKIRDSKLQRIFPVFDHTYWH